MARCIKKWPSGNAGTEIANVILGASSDIINDISGSGLLAKRAQVQFVKSKKGASKNRPMGRFYSDRKKMQRERERAFSKDLNHFEATQACSLDGKRKSWDTCVSQS